MTVLLGQGWQRGGDTWEKSKSLYVYSSRSKEVLKLGGVLFSTEERGIFSLAADSAVVLYSIVVRLFQ